MSEPVWLKNSRSSTRGFSNPTLSPNMLWYNLHPDGRKDQTGEQLLKKLESAKPKDKMMVEQKYGSVARPQQTAEGLKGRARQVRQRSRRSGRMIVAELRCRSMRLAVYEVNGPGTKEFPEKQQYRAGHPQRQTQRTNNTNGGSRTSGFRTHRKLTCRPPRASRRRSRPRTLTITRQPTGSEEPRGLSQHPACGLRVPSLCSRFATASHGLAE